MKILLYSEGMKYIEKSGVGRAIKHQMKALELNGIQYSTNKATNDYDLVHINTVGPFSCLLAIKARRQGKKVIMHAHSTEEDFKNSFFFANALAPFFKKWLKYSYGLADALITPTPYSKRVIDSYNIGLPCRAISNGIDIDRFKNNQTEGNAFRHQYGFKQTDTLVLSVGLQIKRKGILDFLAIAKKLPEVQFIWCGYTHPNLMTSDVKHALKSPPKNVHFLGYVNNMIGAYSGCDLFFMPTYEETEGIVVLEALSMKKPVVIRDIPVYNEWLINKFNCHKATNNQQFKLIIEGLKNHAFDDTTENGYLVVKERTLNNIGLELSDMYTQLLTNK